MNNTSLKVFNKAENISSTEGKSRNMHCTHCVHGQDKETMCIMSCFNFFIVSLLKWYTLWLIRMEHLWNLWHFFYNKYVIMPSEGYTSYRIFMHCTCTKHYYLYVVIFLLMFYNHNTFCVFSIKILIPK